MSEFIAIESMTLVSSDPTVVCSISLLPTAQNKAKILSAKIHVDGDQITVSAITLPGVKATIPDPGPYTVSLNATAAKVKAGGTLVLRQNDESDTINATPQVPGSPPVEVACSCNCKIANAGQNKVKGN
jgi:hypothetical protein